MDNINLLTTILNKNDYFKYFIIVIFILIFINNSNNLLSYRFIVSFIITSGILYFLLNVKISNYKKQSKERDNKHILLKKYNLKYLYNDTKLTEIFIKLIDLEQFNLDAFEISIQNMELFMKKVYIMEHNSVKNKAIIEDALNVRKDCLNQLMSIIINIPSSNGSLLIDKSLEIYNEPNENKLKIYVEQIREITKKHITHMINQLDKSWNNDETYNLSSPIYFDTVEPNSYSDYLFSNKFNIY